MRRATWVAASAVLSLALGGAPAAAADSSPADSLAPVSEPAAVRLASRVIKALGGENGWNNLHYLTFTFQVSVNDTVRASRRHCWDKWTGWHRVEGKTGAGVPYCFIHNVNTREGKAWMGGNPIEGDSLAQLLDRASRIWVNDTYWLNMPFKLKDPGVVLRLDGERREGKQAWDKLSLTFRNVGYTPADHYWLHVNRRTRRIDRWEFVLQGSQPPPEAYDWSGWQQVGGVWLSTRRTQGGRMISFPGLAVPASLPEHAFQSDAPIE